ncbi:BlaI/MecI/CopY family transcriptional regulator [Bradymonas sediminis]|nr:BlaI/MecI/CopY family transcriptional regulator [Bradymonas sediminis]TDP76757.1 putative transcriptional regulator [Bradymonas sediminis]
MKGIRIRPEQEGLRTTLFDLEAEIMECVWSAGWESFAVSDVLEALQESREIAYTTVMTTVVRLFKKGLLSRQKDGRRYVYQSKMSRAQFIEKMTRDVLSSLPEGGRETAMTFLVEQIEDADDAELDRLEALIQARRQERAAALKSSDEEDP